MPLLNDEEVAAALAQLHGWQQDGRSIRRLYEFDGFRAARMFVNRVADLAEELNHHPDILLGHHQVTLTLTSHDLGGITERDVRFARRL